MRLLIISLLLLASHSTYAMSFTLERWNGHDALKASGEIVEGDATKFANALRKLPVAPHGAHIVLLDSPGGSVYEALQMVETIDKYPVHMVIPNNASCASACASILYVNGLYRTMEPFALFGQHSCSKDGQESQLCNEIIKIVGSKNGVSTGSIEAFLKYVTPEEMLWFTREDSDCWGISKYPFSSQSGYEKSEPCVFKMLSGEMPLSQSAWRIDFYRDGYMAFLRPAHDHMRELQLDLWCDELNPNRLFLSMEIAGPADLIQNGILSANLKASPIDIIDADFYVEQMDKLYSRVTVEIPENQVKPFLTKSDNIQFTLKTKPPLENISASTYLSSSREALLFAANNCINSTNH